MGLMQAPGSPLRIHPQDCPLGETPKTRGCRGHSSRALASWRHLGASLGSPLAGLLTTVERLPNQSGLWLPLQPQDHCQDPSPVAPLQRRLQQAPTSHTPERYFHQNRTR